DLCLFRLDPADEFVAHCLEASLLEVVPGICQVALIVLLSDLRLSYSLIERGQGLLQYCFLLYKLLLSAAGIETNDVLAFLHRLARSPRPPTDPASAAGRSCPA